jgi:hypothetical protein
LLDASGPQTTIAAFRALAISHPLPILKCF